MGRRSEQRITTRLPILVRGKDERGAPFLLTAHTHDISGTGASIVGVNGVGRLGEKLEIEYRGKKAIFRVQWVGLDGTPRAGQLGVRCLEPGNYIWDVPLPDWMPDSYDPAAPVYARSEPIETRAAPSVAPPSSGADRRKYPRHSCRIEALVTDEVTSSRLPARVTDLSLGGCYVEMLSPLPLGALVELILNPGGTTLQVRGKVRTSQMGMGMGVAFTGMSPEDFEKLRVLAPPLPATPAAGSPAGGPSTAASQRSENAPANGGPSTAVALEAIARVLFRKGILTRSEVAEELQKLMTPKS
ncbi:MAG TPA: PilZ domain-containing protein [Candidatus Sulfotelmatobacter sp.]|nr:PilZ domain-containing protein [Candidatus Sulfotelmatobacter sp.]